MIWGVTLTPGKVYTELVGDETQLTMASIESRPQQGEMSTNESCSQVMMKTSKAEYVLCTLVHGSIYQQSLDLRLMPREKVTFSVHGASVVYLTGYSMSYPEDFEDGGDFLEPEGGFIEEDWGTDYNPDIKPEPDDVIEEIYEDDEELSILKDEEQRVSPNKGNYEDGRELADKEVYEEEQTIHPVADTDESFKQEEEEDDVIQVTVEDQDDLKILKDEHLPSEEYQDLPPEGFQDPALTSHTSTSLMDHSGEVISESSLNSPNETNQSISHEKPSIYSPQHLAKISQGGGEDTQTTSGVFVIPDATQQNIQQEPLSQPIRTYTNQNAQIMSQPAPRGFGVDQAPRQNIIRQLTRYPQYRMSGQRMPMINRSIGTFPQGNSLPQQSMVPQNSPQYNRVRHTLASSPGTHMGNIPGPSSAGFISHPGTTIKKQPGVIKYPGTGDITTTTQDARDSTIEVFTCDVCNAVFNSQHFLGKHKATHEPSSYPCKICGKEFTWASSCKRHMLYHLGKKRHKCRYCQKGFVQLSDCTIHERVHTGSKPYICSICQQGFRRAHYYTKHMKTVHGISKT